MRLIAGLYLGESKNTMKPFLKEQKEKLKKKLI